MKRVYLHVGLPKSGTTYLQSVLRHNADRLRAAGVLVAGSSHGELVHAGLVIREDPRAAENLNNHQRDSWKRVVRQVRDWNGHAAIISYELLSAASADQARRAIADLGDVEVHVVITARDLARSVVSGWQERLKFRMTLPLEQVGPREDAEFGWRTLDPRGVAERWGSTLEPSRVHLVTAPVVREGPDTLWSRFAEACGLDGVSALDLSGAVPNESLSPVTAELLRRFNETLDGAYPTSAQQALWLRDTLAHQVLVPQGGGPLGISDAQFARWQKRARAVAEALATSGYQVHGDLDDLIPASPAGRLPSEVSTDELLVAALSSMKSLLGLLSSQHVGSATAPTSFRGRLRRTMRTAGSRAAAPGLRAELRRIEANLQTLRVQLEESRRLHQRVADLDDIVTHLLLPAEAGGDDAVHRAIRSYRKDAL